MKRGVLIFILLLIPATTIFADVSKTVNYQGRLRTTANQPVADGQYMITFRLYDADTAGTKVWEESQLVNTKQGYFNTTLGSINAMSASMFDKPLWLALKVGNEAEMSPRMALSATPQAFNIADGMVTTAKIADSAITSAKIADGTILTCDIADNTITAAKIANGAIDTQAKAPWAPVTRYMNGTTNISNPKVVFGQNWSASGSATINFPANYFSSPPFIFCTTNHCGDAHLTMADNNSITTTSANIKTYIWNDSAYVQGGDILFNWLAIGW